MSKKDDDKKSRDNHSGSTSAEDMELSLWMARQWASETPERIELFQVFGRNKLDRGEMIHNESFKPGEKLDIEQANKLANEILAVAQNDCDSSRREAWFQLAIIDRNRKAVPLTRRIGPLQPKRSYAIKKISDLEEGDDEESLNIGALDLKRIQEANAQVKWDKSRNDRVVEGMLFLQDNIIKNQQMAIDRFFDKVMSSFEKMQEAEDRRVQRDVLLEKEKFKIGLMKDGVRTVRNLLPQIFSGTESGAPTNGTNGAPTDGANSTAGAKVYGPSAERILVDNFLNDVEEAKIDLALFGEHDLKDGKRVEIAPGIFSFDQFYILASVRAGHMPVEALDDLMPKSGHKNAITQEQIAKAGEAGVTEGMGMALLEIIGLRTRAKQAREAAAAEANGASKTDPATPKETL